MAFAILPHTPHAAYLANLANDSGKEVLLHLPLEPVQNDNARGIGNIELNLSRGQFSRILGANLASVPYVTGVNTHMGSLITQHPGHMSWLMRELDQRGDLFFVDSYTTPSSVAYEIALENGVPAARRDIFLDNDKSAENVKHEFERLKQESRARGYAIAIGHPNAETLAFLEQALPKLIDEGFELVEKRITRDEVYIADEAFFTGTAAEVTPIREVDNRQIGTGVRGPITERVQSRFFDAVHGRIPEYEEWLSYV